MSHPASTMKQIGGKLRALPGLLAEAPGFFFFFFCFTRFADMRSTMGRIDWRGLPHSSVMDLRIGVFWGAILLQKTRGMAKRRGGPEFKKKKEGKKGIKTLGGVIERPRKSEIFVREIVKRNGGKNHFKWCEWRKRMCVWWGWGVEEDDDVQVQTREREKRRIDRPDSTSRRADITEMVYFEMLLQTSRAGFNLIPECS